jgi:hypothetical protein
MIILGRGGASVAQDRSNGEGGRSMSQENKALAGVIGPALFALIIVVFLALILVWIEVMAIRLRFVVGDASLQRPARVS